MLSRLPRPPSLALALLCAAALALLAPLPAAANEGKWTPQQVLDQGPAWVKAQGFALPLERLWDAKTARGLLSNAVQLPGCSGSFVSKDGLLITNHHCVLSILQEHSTPQQNLVKDGWLARVPGEEKKSASFRVQVPKAFRDVTAEVQAVVPAGAGDLARFRAVETAQKRLVAACERQPQTRCSFAAFDGGLTFALTEFTELADVRLVYAPPESVGNYGGEADNWSWPRHTGDFSLVRVYAEGKPYQPHDWFPVSTEGVRPYDPVAVLGYPGTSYRALVAAEMSERQERWFPALRDFAGEAIGIIQEEAARSKESEVATADEVRGLLNARKNAEGQLAGLARGRILARQQEADARVQAWIAAHPDHPAAKEAARAAAGLAELAKQRLASWDHDFLLDRVLPKALAWPLTLARKAHELAKPDLEREPGWQERDLPRLAERFERDQKRYAQAVDQRLLAAWVRRAQALPAGQRIAAVDAAFGAAGTPAEVSARIATLYAGSRLFDLPVRKAMFAESTAQLEARKDPLVALGLALDAERRALKERRDAWAGAVLRLRPAWRRAVIAEAGHPTAPDANSTLRVTFGRVQGYEPRDAVGYAPQSTLRGALEKHTGVFPFDLAAKVRETASRGRWVDPGLGDVPVDFLADCDTTGGNSGSPVIDAKGRLVGVNFDRVWENVANDFGYNPEVARNVSADVRYMLWMLEEVEHAPGLVGELTGAAR